MSKHNDQMSCVAKYVACGMVVGSAIGTAAAVMMKTKHAMKAKKKSPAVCIRDKAATAMDTVGTIMQNLADMTR